MKLSGPQTNTSTTTEDKCTNNEEYVDLPSPGLGELKHTKNRLKLDLSSKSVLASKSTPASATVDDKLKGLEKAELDEEEEMETSSMNKSLIAEKEENVVTEDLASSEDTFEHQFGLNYKPYDLSPVMELSKSLTSASVA